MPEQHAILSPSGANRWLSCPGSIQACKGIPDVASPYAMEGTIAHALAEVRLKLTYTADEEEKKQLTEELEGLKKNEFYTKEMEEAVLEYVAFVMKSFQEAGENAQIEIEQRLDISHIAPDCFGTGDCVIVSPKAIHIIDLKFGKGVRVNAKENPQLKLYALGAIHYWGFLYEEIQTIQVSIAQVRLDHFDSWTISRDELEAWGKAIKPIAEKAYQGTEERHAGEHCRFCKVKMICRERATAILEGLPPLSENMNDSEIAALLTRAKEVKKWAEELEEYAQEQALKGVLYPGFKLVEGRSQRKYTNQKGLIDYLYKNGYRKKDITRSDELITIGKLEKLLGKQFEELTKDYIDKPMGKPTLVPQADPRKELAHAEQEFNYQN